MATEPHTPSTSDNPTSLPIRSSSGMRTFVSDTYLALRAPGGVDIALLQTSFDLEGERALMVIQEDGRIAVDTSSVGLTPAYLEVARLRLSKEAMSNLIKVLMGAAISAEMLTIQGVQDLLNSVVANHSDGGSQ